MNSSRVFLSRNAWRLGFSSTKQQKFAANDLSISIVALTTANLAYYCLSKHGDDDDQRMSFRGNEWSALLSSMKRKDDLVTECREEALVGVGNECPSGYSESKRFFQVLAYHRELLADYQRRWPEAHEGKSPRKMKRDWPRRIPKAHQIASLEFDLRFCERSEGGDTKKCQDLKFRIACFYIYHESNPVFQKKGLHLVKELANKGHPDGMCLYGLILNEGGVAGLESDPTQAVVWWRRCVDAHRHITATYELAVALYTGDGIAENTELAVSLFRRAAHLGHAGAAYMLGECLLDGVGVNRDRADALEWLVTAAELGHHLARVRVFTILNEHYQLLESLDDEYERKYQEAEKWDYEMSEERSRVVNIERRFSVGGGSKNPVVLAKRKTVVAESRGMKYPTTDKLQPGL